MPNIVKSKKFPIIILAILAAVALIVNFSEIKYRVSKLIHPDVQEVSYAVTDIEHIRPESVVEYTDLKDDLKRSDGCYMFDFNTVKATGFGADGSVRDTEMYYGLAAYLEDQQIYIKSYNNMTDRPLTVEASVLEGLSQSSTLETNINITDEYVGYDAKDLPTGLYRFRAQLTPEGGTAETAYIYFYTNDQLIRLCSVEYASKEVIDKYIQHKETLSKMMKAYAITPEDNLDPYAIYYPVCVPDDPVNYRCDTQKWIDLANSLVDKDDSDAKKLFIFHEWMIKNFAYDTYIVEQFTTRTKSTQDYTGTWSLYDTHVGVCHDYVNALAIMCRSQGIPAGCVNRYSTNHTWSIVYINNRWVELDITWDVNRKVLTDDITDISNADAIYNYGSYFTLQPNYDWSEFPGSDISINVSLMTGTDVKL